MPRPPDELVKQVRGDGKRRNRDSIEESHPAYGVATIHRIQGHRTLAGVTAPNLGTYFELKVHEATRTLEEGDVERQWPGKLLCQIALSPAQFVRMITNTNTHIGTMCTIEQVYEGAYGQGPRAWIQHPAESDPRRLQRETEARLSKLTERSRAAHAEIRTLLAKGSKMKGADRDRIDGLLGGLMQDFSPANVAYGVRIMQEATEQVVTEAQTEADAAIATMLTDLGLRAMAAGAMPELPEGVVARMGELAAPPVVVTDEEG